MRLFTSEDGRPWVAKLLDGDERPPHVNAQSGWEAVLFEATAQQNQQSLAFRPAGWLLRATTQDLLNALQESEWVRTRWSAQDSR